MFNEMREKGPTIWKDSGYEDSGTAKDNSVCNYIVPQVVICELTKMFFKFLWGKVDRVKRLKVIQDHFNGGLEIIDIESLFTSFKNNLVTPY